MKENKSIIPYNQPQKGLRVPSKREVLIIGLSVEEADKKDYLNQRIKEQDETIKKLKDALNSLSGKKEELKYLREFRNMFTLQCIALNTRLTLLQCSNNIKRKRCLTAHKMCKPRKALLDKIIVKT